MQNPTSTNISPISERVLALIAEGVGQFEQSQVQGFGLNEKLGEKLSEKLGEKLDENVTSITNCQKCTLSNSRKRVVVAHKFTPKPFFILAEFAELEDETSETVFGHAGSSNIILNLIDKLGIQNSCHFAFALKCVSLKQIPDDNISVCVQENLSKELNCVQPKTIFCFGMRAFLALWRFRDTSSHVNGMSSPGDMSSRGLTTGSISPPDVNVKIILTMPYGTVDLYVLPTPQELKQFPYWRQPVWSKLAHFKQKKNIDS